MTEAPALPPRRRTIIGIDPGKTGAIAVLTYGAGADDELEVIDMPTIDVGVSGKLRKAIHIRSLLEFFDILQYQSPDLVVLEKVGAMPGQSGMFDFGYGVGVLKTILTLHCLHVEEPGPAVWKKALKVPPAKKPDMKKVAVARAEQLFPKDAHKFRDTSASVKGAVRDGRAEAALLALWGVQFLQESGRC